MEIDPVCGMEVDPASGPPTSVYHDRTYYFCAPGCKRQFDRDPARFIESSGGTPSHGAHG